MAYVKSLNSQQIANAKLIVDTAKAEGIKNGNVIGAILAVASKESEFLPQSENLHYSAKRIMEVWPKTPAQRAAELAADPVKLGNFMYGGRYGNGPTEGFLYRGRGFNQITFKDRYKQIGNAIGINLVANPDLLNRPDIGAKGLVAYFKILFNDHKVDINSPKNVKDALYYVYQANAGKIGKPISDTTGGYAKAASRVDDLVTFVKDHSAATGGGLFFLILTAAAIWKRKQIAEALKKFTSNGK